MAKIILTHEVSNLGSAGDVVEVKDGYARNYLLPRGFATVWTKGGEKQVESLQKARAARAVANLEDAQAQAAQLQSATVKLERTAGAEGRLFGAVQTADVAEAIEAVDDHEGLSVRGLTVHGTPLPDIDAVPGDRDRKSVV